MTRRNSQREMRQLSRRNDDDVIIINEPRLTHTYTHLSPVFLFVFASSVSLLRCSENRGTSWRPFETLRCTDVLPRTDDLFSSLFSPHFFLPTFFYPIAFIRQNVHGLCNARCNALFTMQSRARARARARIINTARETSVKFTQAK